MPILAILKCTRFEVLHYRSVILRYNIFHLVRRGGGKSNGTWCMCATKVKTPERKFFFCALLSIRSWRRMWNGCLNPRIFNLCVLGESDRPHISATFPNPSGTKQLEPVWWKGLGTTVITNCVESRTISAICWELKFDVPIIQFVV